MWRTQVWFLAPMQDSPQLLVTPTPGVLTPLIYKVPVIDKHIIKNKINRYLPEDQEGWQWTFSTLISQTQFSGLSLTVQQNISCILSFLLSMPSVDPTIILSLLPTSPLYHCVTGPNSGRYLLYNHRQHWLPGDQIGCPSHSTLSVLPESTESLLEPQQIISPCHPFPPVAKTSKHSPWTH